MEAADAAKEMRRDCLAVRVRVLNRTLTRTYEDVLRPHGLSAAQLHLLAAIQAVGPARSSEVAELLSTEISTLSRNVHLMELKGWIDVERAERGNGRVLSLTGAGERKIVEATPAWRDAQRKAKALVGDDGTRLIKRLVDGLWADSPAAT